MYIEAIQFTTLISLASARIALECCNISDLFIVLATLVQLFVLVLLILGVQKRNVQRFKWAISALTVRIFVTLLALSIGALAKLSHTDKFGFVFTFFKYLSLNSEFLHKEKNNFAIIIYLKSNFSSFPGGDQLRSSCQFGAITVSLDHAVCRDFQSFLRGFRRFAPNWRATIGLRSERRRKWPKERKKVRHIGPTIDANV